MERVTPVLALDVGTSSVRASLYDERGVGLPRGAARILHQVDHLPDGGVETGADALVACAATAIDRCLREHPGLAVAAVGISCFWHSLMGVDAGMRPVTPVLIWADTRSAPDVVSLAGRLDAEAARRRTGCRLHASYPSAKLCWIRRARPEWWGAARHWLSFGEYLTHWLTGELAASVSMASGSGLYDQAAGRWDADVLDAVGLEAGRLPPVADLAETDLRCRHAGRWPGLAGARVLLPAGDGACNNVGSGCMGPGMLALMIGTSAATRALRPGGPWAVPPSLWQYRLDRRRGLVGGALSNGGNLHQWLLGTLRLPGAGGRGAGAGMPEAGAGGAALDGGAAATDLDAAVGRMRPDGHGLTFLPLLAGERSPGWASGAFGGIVGLRESTTPLDLARAGMEAVAQRIAAVVRDLEGAVGTRARIIGSGGGLWHSAAWAQILADALGRDLERSAEPEASSRGAALLALESTGALADAAGVAPPVAGTVVHDGARHALYAAAWERQQRLYALLRGDGLVGFGVPERGGAAAAAGAEPGR